MRNDGNEGNARNAGKHMMAAQMPGVITGCAVIVTMVLSAGVVVGRTVFVLGVRLRGHYPMLLLRQIWRWHERSRQALQGQDQQQCQ